MGLSRTYSKLEPFRGAPVHSTRTLTDAHRRHNTSGCYDTPRDHTTASAQPFTYLNRHYFSSLDTRSLFSRPYFMQRFASSLLSRPVASTLSRSTFFRAMSVSTDQIKEHYIVYDNAGKEFAKIESAPHCSSTQSSTHATSSLTRAATTRDIESRQAGCGKFCCNTLSPLPSSCLRVSPVTCRVRI